MPSQRTEEQQALLDRFGQRVRDLRTERGLSQERLADLAGLHRTYIGSLERGERNVALLNLHGLATALDTGVQDLVE